MCIFQKRSFCSYVKTQNHSPSLQESQQAAQHDASVADEQCSEQYSQSERADPESRACASTTERHQRY